MSSEAKQKSLEDDLFADDVNLNYRKAIEDLRRINDELFYNDLKVKLTGHLDRHEISYEASSKGLEAMKSTISRVTSDIDLKMDQVNKEFTDHSFRVLDDMKAEMHDSFQTSKDELQSIIKAFLKLQENFLTIHHNFSQIHEVLQQQIDERINLLEHRMNERFELLDHRLSEQVNSVNSFTMSFQEVAVTQQSMANEQYVQLQERIVEDRTKAAKKLNFVFGILILVALAEGIRFIL